MELEFDKEMDAILRRARIDLGLRAGDDQPPAPAGHHLDADTLAAFAENALPEKSRGLYMTHLADCDRCRRVLSRLMMLNSEVEVEKPSAAIVAPVVEVSIPWYQKLFKTPNLAMAMGALVVVFGGFLGFLALRDSGSSEPSVAVVTDKERAAGRPFEQDKTQGTAAANSAAPGQANTNMVADPPSSASANRPASPTEPNVERPSVIAKDAPEKPADAMVGRSGEPEDDKNEVAATREQPRGKAAPPEPVAAAPAAGVSARDEEKADDRDSAPKKKAAPPPSAEDEQAKLAESRSRRDAPPSAAKSGPARSGPLNTQQNQIASQNMAEMPVERKVGGKMFSNRNGVWYDSAYKNQATMNFRRGTDDYKALDGGLRSIADALGGTVVIVWKEKAYRIR